MGKRAVIYVRTSSEHQGEKSSPVEQEADCQRLASEHGLTVVHIYKDIEKYRVKNKLVEPSGTRYDRPGLLSMLRDAARDQFDVILAWREDRLYRGMRSMLQVLEVTQEHRITIMLARETFDPKIAPLKAWVAQMELDGIRQRMSMGVKARLRAGKANTGQDRYGYQRNGEIIEIVDEEAYWVRQIFEWYNNRVPALEIRRRLIAANAPQKGSQTPRRIHWARSSIQTILKGAKDYTSGIKIQRMAGEAFEIPVPPILDQATYERFLKIRQENKTYPSRHVKRDYLIGGLLRCACNRSWGGRTDNRTCSKKYNIKVRKQPSGRYFCGEEHLERIHPDCPRQIGCKKADDYVWERVCEAINQPEILIARARESIDELRADADAISEDQECIQKELDALALERQWVITQARKGAITEGDMDYQLSALSMQEVTLKRELTSRGQVLNIDNLGDWETQIAEYFADLREGLTSLNIPPESEEDRKEKFELKRQVVLNLVEKVTIDRNRRLKVCIRLDLLKFLRGEFGEIKNNGTCADPRSADVR
jgi:site-specific DNA recombinase